LSLVLFLVHHILILLHRIILVWQMPQKSSFWSVIRKIFFKVWTWNFFFLFFVNHWRVHISSTRYILIFTSIATVPRSLLPNFTSTERYASVRPFLQPLYCHLFTSTSLIRPIYQVLLWKRTVLVEVKRSKLSLRWNIVEGSKYRKGRTAIENSI